MPGSKTLTEHHHRRSIRLRHYDYARPGSYFLTLCTYNRKLLFGYITDNKMVLNTYGQIVAEELSRTPTLRSEVNLDEFVVMPNHLHAILTINERAPREQPVGAHGRAPLHRPPRSVGAMVAGFKAVVTKRINAVRGTRGAPVWQRNYYEHVIRSEADLARVRRICQI